VNVYQEAVEHANPPRLADALGLAIPKLEPSSVSDACPVVGAFRACTSVRTGASNERIPPLDPTTREIVIWTGIARKPIFAGVGATI
jgi:hypothetical protein